MKTAMLAVGLIALIGWTERAPGQATLGQPVVRNDIPSAANADVGRLILAGAYSPAEFTAAKIKADELQGNSRIAAVRYLAGVDCRQYPEAEAGLVAALRTDPLENVRYETVLALGGRATTPRLLEALSVTALGSDLDGNPAEWSERVRAAAHNVLNQRVFSGLGAPIAVRPPSEGWIPGAGPIQNVGYLDQPQAPALQREREIAQTVSVRPPVASPRRSRPFRQFLLSFLSFRAKPESASKDVERRLHGPSPLRSEAAPGISSRQAPFVPNAYLPPYNSEQ
jgi:hypothetical protein